MANGRMSISVLSDYINNYIIDMFDNNIKYCIEQYNTILIEIKNTIIDLQTKIKNNDSILSPIGESICTVSSTLGISETINPIKIICNE